MATAVLSLTSDLKRKKWIREGLIQAKSRSFWTPLTGMSSASIVYQVNSSTASEGHTVVFDFDGNLASRAIRGKNTAFGKGEQKKKFSDKVTVDRYRLVVDNGDDFDGVDIGDLNITQHGDSRTKLGDLFIRFKDQGLFDSSQGNLGQAPSHTIDLGTTFTYNILLDIMKTLKTSNGFTTGGVRRPLDGFKLEEGNPVWMMVIDTAMANILKQDTAGWQTIVRTGDVRGNDNRLIKNVIGRIGNMIIVEADNFFGETSGVVTNWGLEESDIEISGLRQYDGTDPTTALWTGQTGFDLASTDLHSRGIILGAGALQLAMGKMPDYKFQESEDFGIKSESALETWLEIQKTNMTAENVDYAQAKVAALDFGVVAIDLEVQ